MKSSFAANLKRLRQQYNLTQEQICRDISTDVNLYYHYEKANGNTMPPYIVIIRLSRRFDASIEYLFGLTDDPAFAKNEMPPPDDVALKALFVSRLSSLRKHKGLTQAVLAQIVGVTLRGYQSYESESNPTMPSYGTLVAIRNEFECSIDYLLGNTDFS